MTELTQKLYVLQQELEEAGSVAVAFSGGTDSTFLLAFARSLPAVEAAAITVRSPLMPDADLTFAQAFCEERGILHLVLDVDPLANDEVRANPPDRCYHCKRLIMSAVVEAARERDAVPCDGSNADDARDYRPGSRAIQELGILSPLANAGLTKAEIRKAAQQLELPNWDTPASACLASRIPYGTPLERGTLEAVQRAEAALRSEGLSQVRVRAHGDLARIEVPSADILHLAATPLRERIAEAVREAGFAYIALDLDGYRMGSLNEEILEASHDH